ncbi:hypothetical protein Sant_3717 [Sodalis praecaptivus]|uniref:Uncharacterized protein n=1 Tax=Sodalis praecaptivus TaxID=1239307 RepID=W0I1P2_9GAMM|nr:hypothetical protein [Sodalis praecaptivus]AHF78697.1 hypothetical protein Sant_3717 [Sodalis praecaptivus]
MNEFFSLLESMHIDFSQAPGGMLLVGETLDLSASRIDRLPNDMVIIGSLILRGCNITALPSGLRVLDYLDLNYTAIRRLPADLHVGGSLYIERSQLRQLPDNFSLDDHLVLENTPITSLPRNMCVGGCLNILGTGITYLPEDLYVGERLLLDAEKMTGNVAWRQLRNAELPPNPLFSPASGSHQRDLTVYAVSLAGEIKISAGRFYGSPSAFIRNNPPQPFRQRVLECVEELNQNAMIG